MPRCGTTQFVMRCTREFSTALSPGLSTFWCRNRPARGRLGLGLTVSSRVASNTALFCAAPRLLRGSPLTAPPAVTTRHGSRTAHPLSADGPPLRRPPRNNDGNQTDIPAFQSEARAHARLSGAHEVARRPRRDRGASCQRPQAPRDLKRHPVCSAAGEVPPVCCAIRSTSARVLAGSADCGDRPSIPEFSQRRARVHCARRATGCR